MARSVLIVGNGLGMALDPSFFALHSGLTSIWSNADYLNAEHKALIQSAISGTSNELPPSSEEQLDKLQVAIIATEFLRGFEIDGASWVSDAAKDLPSVFKKFIHEVALYFHRSGYELPAKFVDPLCKYLSSSKSHVATLNYDNLLYDSFVNQGVLKGYRGALIDGFWQKDGFDEDHLDRYDVTNHGWYLHLHGSPLYVGNRKIMGAERAQIDPNEDSHIVLAHVEHKPLIIESSQILSAYWRRLERAFDECSRIFLFGYSGLDVHLNNRIRLRNEKKVCVIEWTGTGNAQDRRNFWKNALNAAHLELTQIENILDFCGWE